MRAAPLHVTKYGLRREIPVLFLEGKDSERTSFFASVRMEKAFPGLSLAIIQSRGKNELSRRTHRVREERTNVSL